ncbi:MAG: putative zinc-binding protein [Syntrophomonadaceae bacterium]|jgi:uncharacterized metal-binding protein
MKKKIVVMPCSGIGKAYGEISRQAAFHLAEELKPDQIDTACLALLMIDDPETKQLVKNNYVITVDGCAKDCARKNVESIGKPVDKAVRTIDIFKEHRDLKPEGVLNLGEPGMKLAQFLAEKLAVEVDCLAAKED